MSDSTSDVVTIGVLGAAKISGRALLVPAAETDGVEVTMIAARDRSRAEAQAAEHGISGVVADYEAVLASEVDAVYNPLPISLHHPWTIAALEAGKHVLCEKPFASNTALAEEMVAAGVRADRVLMEAFHWRYHPLAGRIREILDGGSLGTITHIDAGFTVAIPAADDVRQSFELAGGALMDLGCYPVQWARFVGGEPEVVSAEMTEGRPHVDVITDIELSFAGGATGHVHTAMNDGVGQDAWLEVQGSSGTLRVTNPIAPHQGHRLDLTLEGQPTATETVDGRTTYHHQIEAFRDAVRDGVSVPTGGDDAVNTMRVIDAAYVAAGFPVRGTSPA